MKLLPQILSPGEADPLGLGIGGAAIHPGGEGIAPQLDRHGIEHQGAGHYPLVPHLLADPELLGEVEAQRILDQVAEEQLGAGIGEGVADVGVDERRQAALAVGGAEAVDAAVAVPAGVEVGLVAADGDTPQQETGPAGRSGDGAEIGVGRIDDQQAEAQQEGMTHRWVSMVKGEKRRSAHPLAEPELTGCGHATPAGV